MKGEQLPLSVQLPRTASFESFHAGPNALVVGVLRGSPASVWLYGAPGSGKTHLLQACARLAPGAAYLPLATLEGNGPALLEGFETLPLLCLDDVHAVAAQPAWALALLRLIDLRQRLGLRLLLTGTAAPDRQTLALPDLASRLAALTVLGLQPLDARQQAGLLEQLARNRGLELGEDAARWLLQTQARDSASLAAALDRLDRASLSAQRRLTLPFVTRVLTPPAGPDAPARPAARTASG